MATATVAGSATCSRRGLAGRSFSTRLVRPATVSFSDEGHLRYYASARCALVGERKKKKKEEEGEKRRDKLMKGLRKDLMEFSSMRLGGPDDYDAGEREGNVVAGEAESKMISEAADVLLAQLTQLRREAKETKRRRKKQEKKSAMKSAKAKGDDSSSSSSSSSESSDGERDTTTVVKMSSSIRTTAPGIPQGSSSPKSLAVEVGAKNVMLETNVAVAAPPPVVKAVDNKIEVCMGGKCRKSGAMELLAEIDRMVGVEGAVVGCKCMGKCREGPNVRVVNRSVEEEVKFSRNPLCIGVGLEDVGAIVGNFFGEGPKDVGFLLA